MATELLLDTHGFNAAAVPEPNKFVDALTQRDVVPVTVGNGFTVTVKVKVIEHWFGEVPDVAVTLYVAVTGVDPNLLIDQKSVYQIRNYLH